ncbi:pseudouridine synthase [Pelomyxa schiedti]|nr:pseudouridine synthase [Pelomyxa schiedti]
MKRPHDNDQVELTTTSPPSSSSVSNAPCPQPPPTIGCSAGDKPDTTTETGVGVAAVAVAPKSKKARRQEARQLARAHNRAQKQLARHKKQEEEGVITAAYLAETSYVLENELRRVVPYYYTFTVNAKDRWLGRTALDVFKSEFIGHDSTYYVRQIAAGNIKINDMNITCETIIKSCDRFSHIVHRHEPPVSAKPIVIIAQTADLVVVDKPASIPIHPSGRYRHNSLLFIVAKEFKLKSIFTIYRLDRLTSGIVIMARSTQLAAKFQQQVRDRNVTKVYLAIAKGEFPEAVEVDQPILVQHFRIGINMVHPSGKSAKTSFQRIKYDPVTNTSLVRCVPHTGRTHQIRVHLQWLGHPIANDPIYSGTPGVLPPAGHAMDECGPDSEDPFGTPAETNSTPEPTPSNTTTTATTTESSESTATSLPTATTTTTSTPTVQQTVTPTARGIITPDTPITTTTPQQQPHSVEANGYDPVCPQCRNPPPDPSPDDCIWLHALSYKCEGCFDFETPLPSWAKPFY